MIFRLGEPPAVAAVVAHGPPAESAIPLAWPEARVASALPADRFLELHLGGLPEASAVASATLRAAIVAGAPTSREPVVTTVHVRPEPRELADAARNLLFPLLVRGYLGFSSEDLGHLLEPAAWGRHGSWPLVAHAAARLEPLLADPPGVALRGLLLVFLIDPTVSFADISKAIQILESLLPDEASLLATAHPDPGPSRVLATAFFEPSPRKVP